MPSRAVALLCLFRLAVLTDGEPSRSLRQLRKLEVVDAVAR